MRFNLFKRSSREAASDEALPSTLLDAAAKAPDTQAAPGFVVYSLLLDPQKHVQGLRMTWHVVGAPREPDPVAELNGLAALVGEHFTAAETGWLMGKTTIFLDAALSALQGADLGSLPPEHLVLCIGMDDLLAPEARPAMMPAMCVPCP